MSALTRILDAVTKLKSLAWLYIMASVLAAPLVLAQEAVAPVVDHSQMDHGSTPAPAKAGGKADHGAMQGGSAPPDARDPHAYSGGYAFGPDRELRMGDEQAFHSILFDRLEAARTRDRTTGQYELQARFGRDYDRAVLKAEGEVYGGRFEEART